jgi:heme exporter protein A
VIPPTSTTITQAPPAVATATSVAPAPAGAASPALAPGSEQPPAIRLQGVSRSFGDVQALVDVTLDLPVGATVAVVGANGAGKSTLLATIAGLLRPTRGAVSVLGATGDRDGHRAASLGVLTHTTMLYDHLTGRENLELHARLRGVPTFRVDDLLEELGLTAVADRPAGTCSHGIRKRLALARALLHDPRVLVLDEPFAGLDPSSRQRLADTLDGMRGARTIVFSTHDLDHAAQASDLVLELADGAAASLVPGAHDGARPTATSVVEPPSRRTAGMVRTAWEVLRKDVTVEARSRAMASSVLVLAVLLATILGMAFEPLAGSPHAVSGVLWVLVAFTGLHGLVRSFDEDLRDDALRGLLLSGADPAGLYLGRVASTAIGLLVVAAAAALTVAVLFAAPGLLQVAPRLLLVVSLAVAGLAAIGTILTVLSRHSRLGETLLPLLFLPLAVPVLLGGIGSVETLLETGVLDGAWLRVLAAYAVGMLTVGAVIFDHAVEG